MTIPAELLLRNDETVRVRPIQPRDEPLLEAFHRGLSDRTVYQRYFHMMGLGFRIAHERLARICASDSTADIVLVMEHGPPAAPALTGVARLTPVPGTSVAEFAVVITDAWQGVGAGAALMRVLIDAGRRRGFTRIEADVLSGNTDMQRLCRTLGMTVTPAGEPGLVRATLTLSGPPGVRDGHDSRAGSSSSVAQQDRRTASERPVSS